MNDNINESEKGFYILGGESDFFPDEDTNNNRTPWWVWAIIGTVALATIIFLVVHFMDKPSNDKVAATSSSSAKADVTDIWYNNTDASRSSCVIVSDTLIDSLHLKIITPYNTVPELHVGMLDTSDADIVLCALAADLGGDSYKGKIIGAFVCDGEPISWGGGRKLGYCAILDENITVGVIEDSPLFERAIEQEGYFFRQYPAVDNGVMVENNPKNASLRRALCVLNGKVCIVATNDRVLMNDYSAALVKLGVENAIFLIGGTADGWYRTEDGTFYRLGYKVSQDKRYINYIVFRAQ